jgi:hypothetical protein
MTGVSFIVSFRHFCHNRNIRQDRPLVKSPGAQDSVNQDPAVPQRRRAIDVLLARMFDAAAARNHHIAGVIGW